MARNREIIEDDLEIEPGVEIEDTGSELITDPFDPRLIRIDTKPLTVDLLVRRIKAGEIDLSPDFQREAGLWRPGAMSRLIESMLVRIPLPAFYMDASEDDRWLVVDGLQRLTVLKRFMLERSLALCELEFVTQFNGKHFEELPRAMQRRLEETQVIVYLIQPGTPPELKFNIFKRINTGGLPLSPQEIRHALNQGPATELLEQLVELESFQRVAGRSIRNHRMTDRECALRFIAFSLHHYNDYRSSDLDGFLNNQMKIMNSMPKGDLKSWIRRFDRVMEIAWELFERDAFRKRYSLDARRKPINKALFEAWSAALDKLPKERVPRLIKRKDKLKVRFVQLMNESPDFDDAISQGTGDPSKVRTRFTEIEKLVEEVGS